MIEPVLPPGLLQAMPAKAERPPIAVVLQSLPQSLAAPAQPREIGGTIVQAAPDGSSVLHTAAGDIAFRASVILTAGKTATLHLAPTPAGLAAAIQFHGPTGPLPPATTGLPNSSAGGSVSSPKQPGTATPLPPANAGLRDAALLLNQLAAAAELPTIEGGATLSQSVPPSTSQPPVTTLASSLMTSPALGAKALADPASLSVAMMAALRRSVSRLDEDGARRDEKDRISAVPQDATYRSFIKPSEIQDQLLWRQIQVVDESQIVPVFLGYQPPADDSGHSGEETPQRERPARFTVRLDLEFVGAVRIDSVYRERRLEMLLTLDTAPDQEMQTIVRERLAALSDEFDLSISLKVGAPAIGAG